MERKRWWRNMWTWSTSLSMDTSGIYLQTQNILQNTFWEWARVPDHWKIIYKPLKNSRRKEWGGERRMSKSAPDFGRWGNWSRGQIPAMGQLFGTEEKHYRLLESEPVSLWIWMEWESYRQSLPQPYLPWTGMKVPWNVWQIVSGI